MMHDGITMNNETMQQRGVSLYGYGLCAALQAGVFATLHHRRGGTFSRPVAAPIAGLAGIHLASYVVGKEYVRTV